VRVPDPIGKVLLREIGLDLDRRPHLRGTASFLAGLYRDSLGLAVWKMALHGLRHHDMDDRAIIDTIYDYLIRQMEAARRAAILDLMR
jgi:hypothetical protein